MLRGSNSVIGVRERSAALGVSVEAVALTDDADLIDLHLDTTVPMRIARFDPARRHRTLASPFVNHADLPRIREVGMTGVVWDIPTNPLRTAEGRVRTARRNLSRQAELFARHPDDFQVVRTLSDYRRACESGRTAVWFSFQGGQAIDRDHDALDELPDDLLHRVTLVHFTRSRIGTPSSQVRRVNEGLTPFGREFVTRLNERRILVDLAHINRAGFFDAIDAHDRALPVVVTHTGMAGVRPLWRNIDDEQVRAIAETGGTVGILFHSAFLTRSMFRWSSEAILRHMQHAIELVGDDFVSIGTDFDGCVIPPKDIRDITELPRLTQGMLDLKWSEERIRKILGRNYLRVVGMVRP